MEESERSENNSSVFVSVGIEDNIEKKPNVRENMDPQDGGPTKSKKAKLSKNEDCVVDPIKIEPLDFEEEEMSSSNDFPVKVKLY